MISANKVEKIKKFEINKNALGKLLHAKLIKRSIAFIPATDKKKWKKRLDNVFKYHQHIEHLGNTSNKTCARTLWVKIMSLFKYIIKDLNKCRHDHMPLIIIQVGPTLCYTDVSLFCGSSQYRGMSKCLLHCRY